MADPIELLKELIRIPSVSADQSRREDARRTAGFIESKLEALGAETKLVENEIQGLNPLLLGKLGNDSNKFTIAIYSHYDVQPALKSDGWETDPFEPTEKDGYIYGRGASDDKGPIAATLAAIEEIMETEEFPINFRFIYEGEEESGSGGFEETLLKHADFLGKIDGIMILDTAWFSDNAPGMDYGFRGLAYMGIEIQGPEKDIHSGLAGGIIREPMTDLVKILSQLHDENHKATIPGFYDDVAPVTQEEEQFYENIEFDIEEFKKANGLPSLLSNDKKTILMDNWRNPCLSIHGIEGAFYEPGAKTVIPGKVIGKVSMRLVPNQEPQKIAKLFTDYVEQLFEKLQSPNKITVHTYGTGDWWYGDPNSFLYSKARKVLKEYWGTDPTLTRSGGSIPIIPFMEKLFEAPAIAIGIGQNSDGAHSQNERVRIKNIIGAKEVLKLLFSELKSK